MTRKPPWLAVAMLASLVALSLVNMKQSTSSDGGAPIVAAVDAQTTTTIVDQIDGVTFEQNATITDDAPMSAITTMPERKARDWPSTITFSHGSTLYNLKAASGFARWPDRPRLC